MEHNRFLRAADPRGVALTFILKYGLNRVSWHDCRFIWDSRSLIEANQTDHQVRSIFIQTVVINLQPEVRLLSFCSAFANGVGCDRWLSSA